LKNNLLVVGIEGCRNPKILDNRVRGSELNSPIPVNKHYTGENVASFFKEFLIIDW